MGCPDTITIDKTLLFSITTHAANGGVADTDDDPTYRIYNVDGVQVYPLDGEVGIMARVDDANTTGFYSGTVVCSNENGFVENINYTVYIEAVVDGDVGAISYEFEVIPVPDCEFNIDTTDLCTMIRNYLAGIEISPTRTVIGPCQQPVVSAKLTAEPQPVKEFMLPSG